MNKIKIHFLVSSLHGGGAERVLALLANEFDVQNYLVSIITFNQGNAYQINPNIKKIQLHHGNIKSHKIRSWNNLRKYYKDRINRPDVLISFLTHNSAIAITVARLYRIKVIVSEHNNHLYKESPEWLTNFTRNYLYRFANIVTVLTNYDVDFFKKKGAKVIVMPNPCTFHAIVNKQINRKKHILAIGNLDRYDHKGFDNLIKLIAPILKEFTQWKLLILGSGNTGITFLKKLAKNEGIIDRIEFLGFQDTVQDFMKTSEIFILSSRYEGLPMVLLEAMSQGMACISYDCITGPSEIIQNNINGLLIEDQKQEVMKKGLKNLIENESFRKSLQQEAPKRLIDFELNVIIKKWETLFKEIGL